MIAVSSALLAYFQNGVPLYVVIVIGAVVFFLLSFAWYFLTRRRLLAIREREETTQPSTAEIEREAENRKALNAQHESEKAAMQSQHESEKKALQDEIASLHHQHNLDVEGRKSAFFDLQNRYDILKEQNDGLQKELVQFTWLRNIASTQAENIDQYVTLDRIERGDMQLNDGVPFVKFGIYVSNDSVLDVALELEKGGYIVFREQKLVAPIDIVTDGLEYVKFQTVRCLVIEQRLTREEAHFINGSEARDDAIFYFDRLTLTIKGRRRSLAVSPKRLDMNKGVTLHNEPLTLSR